MNVKISSNNYFITRCNKCTNIIYEFINKCSYCMLILNRIWRSVNYYYMYNTTEIGNFIFWRFNCYKLFFSTVLGLYICLHAGPVPPPSFRVQSPKIHKIKQNLINNSFSNSLFDKILHKFLLQKYESDIVIK